MHKSNESNLPFCSNDAFRFLPSSVSLCVLVELLSLLAPQSICGTAFIFERLSILFCCWVFGSGCGCICICWCDTFISCVKYCFFSIAEHSEKRYSPTTIDDLIRDWFSYVVGYITTSHLWQPLRLWNKILIYDGHCSFVCCSRTCRNCMYLRTPFGLTLFEVDAADATGLLNYVRDLLPEKLLLK